MKVDVFTQDVFDMWIEYKIKAELDSVRLRSHPQECFLYVDIWSIPPGGLRVSRPLRACAFFSLRS
jgi:hypothetical protein